MEDKNTAIITYIDEYCAINLEKDFLETLFEKAKYTGKVVILDYGMSQDVAQRISQKFKVIILKCNKKMPVFSNRYYDIPRAIDILGKEITHIMTIDGGDIWFQDKISFIFENSKDGIGCVEEQREIGKDDFTEHCLGKLTDLERKKIEKVLWGKMVKNSGMICGPKEMVKKLILDISNDMKNNTTEYFGVDQLFFNYEWYLLDERNRVELLETANFVLISNVGKYKMVDDMILDDKGDKVVVVHNAGANWRVIKKTFDNQLVNEEQYIEVRKTLL